MHPVCSLCSPFYAALCTNMSPAYLCIRGRESMWGVKYCTTLEGLPTTFRMSRRSTWLDQAVHINHQNSENGWNRVEKLRVQKMTSHTPPRANQKCGDMPACPRWVKQASPLLTNSEILRKQQMPYVKNWPIFNIQKKSFLDLTNQGSRKRGQVLYQFRRPSNYLSNEP